MYGLYRRREAQSGRLQRLPQVLSRFEVLPFDEQAAEHYGSLYALLERLGTPIGTGDTQIAAIALSRDLTVVTGNVRHFSRVPNLPVENWLP